MLKPLEQELDFSISHQKELVKRYKGRHIVIKNNGVIGDHEDEAIKKTLVDHELGTFLVQKCESGEKSYIQIYHSRVAFT